MNNVNTWKTLLTLPFGHQSFIAKMQRDLAQTYFSLLESGIAPPDYRIDIKVRPTIEADTGRIMNKYY